MATEEIDMGRRRKRRLRSFQDQERRDAPPFLAFSSQPPTTRNEVPANMAKNKNRAATLAIDGQVIAGVKKDLQSVSQLPLGGEIYTAASVVAFLQSRIDAANAVAIAKAQYAAALAAYDAINTKGTGVVTGLRQYVMNAYGKTSPLLADFGFVPPKVTVLTADQKAAAAAKRLATRLARGTVG